MTKNNDVPSEHIVNRIVRAALEEDLGAIGDITSAAVIPETSTSAGSLVAREQGVIAGLEIGLRVFEIFDSSIEIKAHVSDGDSVQANTVLARIDGPTRSLLAAERTCLNLLGHLSGIATATAQLVERISHTSARIIDTRKTTPGLRSLEKYAVVMGGGANHRFGLYDAILIKDNHLATTGNVAATIKKARKSVGHAVTIQIEVDNLEQLEQAINAGADSVLLDNMDVEKMTRAVTVSRERVVLEASGGITETTVAGIAETGVNFISVGALTHSSPSFDVALDFDTI